MDVEAVAGGVVRLGVRQVLGRVPLQQLPRRRRAVPDVQRVDLAVLKPAWKERKSMSMRFQRAHSEQAHACHGHTLQLSTGLFV